MGYENPHELLARLRLGREEFCQRLLTSLILGGPYPRWNTRSVPSGLGVRFLQRLDELSFGVARWVDGAVFVDELDLPRRHDDERGGAPDQAVVWPGRLWLIELKTEAASHRRDQLPSYFELAGHHYPRVPVDITYLTPTMSVPPPGTSAPNRYAHVTWSAVSGLIVDVWGGSADEDERVVCEVLLRTLDQLALSPRAWRLGMTGLATKASEAIPQPEPAAHSDESAVGWAGACALQLAQLTARDGRQRALEVEAGSLEALQALRFDVLAAICEEPAGSPLRRVRPWLWSAETSGGQPITPCGERTGYEIRVSRYARPVC